VLNLSQTYKLIGSSLLALALAIASIACGPTSAGDDDDSANGDGGAADAPTGAQPDARPDDINRPDAGNCGAQEEEIELVNLGDPPDLLIVLDRSGSMILAPGFPPIGESKWSIMSSALTDLTAAKEGNIRFGLSVFPTDNACGVSPGAAVPIAIDNAAEIASWMSSNGPDGNTPAQFGLQEALDIYTSIPVNPEGRYVLFATDGIPNCGGDPPNVDIVSDAETVAAVEALTAAGIPTYVLGFGDPLGFDPAVLNDAALAGGVPRAGGPPHFYHANNAAELDAVLEDISGGVIVPSCSYELASPPPDPDLVTVLADGVAVPRSPSHANGWDYHPDASTITFFGTYCTDIEAGIITSVQFIFGCPGPIVD
jgi:hypothetical protein